MPSASPPDFRLRRATPDDADAAVRLRALMFRSMGVAAADEPGWQGTAREWFLRELATDVVCFVLAEVGGIDGASGGGSVVAAGAMGTLRRETPSPFCPNGVYGLLANVATEPQFRGRGLARSCVETVFTWFRDETDAIQLDLYATGEGRGIYERLGFRDVAWPGMRMHLPRA